MVQIKAYINPTMDDNNQDDYELDIFIGVPVRVLEGMLTLWSLIPTPCIYNTVKYWTYYNLILLSNITFGLFA